MKTTIGTYILEDLRQLAYHAYRNISFSTEKRAEQTVSEYSYQLQNDLNSIPEDQHERYTANYRKYLTAWLSAKSKCASSMITGPSNFPVERMRKRNEIEHRRGKEFTEWRERALKSIEKQVLANRTPEQMHAEKWANVSKSILSSAQTIFDIDNGINTYSARVLFVNSITGMVKRIAGNGDTITVQKCLTLIRELNQKGPKPIVTDKNSIWKLELVAEVVRENQADTAIKEPSEQEINGIRVVLNYQEDRIQLFFQDKAHAMKYKGAGLLSGWNWSPKNNAWQRKLTANGKWSAKNLTSKVL